MKLVCIKAAKRHRPLRSASCLHEERDVLRSNLCSVGKNDIVKLQITKSHFWIQILYHTFYIIILF